MVLDNTIREGKIFSGSTEEEGDQGKMMDAELKAKHSVATNSYNIFSPNKENTNNESMY